MQNCNDTNLIYDYIIIGSGPAGAVMAKTLSDYNNSSVLLIEAGDNDTNETPIKNPRIGIREWFPYYFWQGVTVPQKDVGNKMFHWTTGRTLGGASSVNNGLYVRPTSNSLSQWEHLLGPIWSSAQAALYFTQLERYNGRTDNPRIHGYNGRIDIRQAPQQIPDITRKLVSAITEATGYPAILDYNNPNTPLGPFYQWQLYQTPDGQRVSSSTAFLSEDIVSPDGLGVNGRKLRVLVKSTAFRVIFDNNKNATGVEFLWEGNYRYACANKKVIISAGINSSQLLMLSGIGPSDQLKSLQIPVIFDNKNVGTGLANQVYSSVVYTINPKDLPGLAADPHSLYTGGAFLPDPDDYGSLQRFIEFIGSVESGRLVLSFMNLLPKSRGSIVLQNNDYLKIVLADEGFLNNPDDLAVIKNIYRTYIVYISETLASIDEAYQLVSPTLDIIGNDTLLEDFIKNNIVMANNEQGSNRMAPLEQGGVVDERARVYGVNNLVVADASIIPFTVDANGSSTAYLIGYTIANQLIQEDILLHNNPYPLYPLGTGF